MSRAGISIGRSEGKGRGSVSNSKGKPITAATTNTTEPMRR